MQSPIVFLDLNMPHMTGQDVLRELKINHPQVPVIIITANSEIETAVECLRLGAHDYLVKPIDLKMFSSALRNALEISLLRNEVMSLKGISFAVGGPRHKAFDRIVTRSPGMLSIFQYIESIAASGMPTLILGETGSGKELIAKAIHEISGVCRRLRGGRCLGARRHPLFRHPVRPRQRGLYRGRRRPLRTPRKGRRWHHFS